MAKTALGYNGIVWQLTTSWGDVNEGEARAWLTDTITYVIPDTAPAGRGSEANGFIPLTSFMKEQTRLAFELWDDVIARNLVETNSHNAGISFGRSSQTFGDGTYARPYLTDRGSYDQIVQQDIWLSSNWTSNTEAGFVFGRYGFTTAIHEIGHALGLSHPGSYDASRGPVTYETGAEYAQDTGRFTVMSYFDEKVDQSGANYAGHYASTPLLHDIMVAQWLYGADMTTRTGDTTYGFGSNAGRAVYDFTVNQAPVMCIWDAGGNDTINLSGYAGGQTLSLEEGVFSSVMGMAGNFSIAFGCVIENATGGSGGDILLGNASGNVLYGYGGNDHLVGQAGGDVVIGGTGSDVLQGDGTVRGYGDAFAFVQAGAGQNGVDVVLDFDLGIDRVWLDDAFFGADYARLAGNFGTTADGSAWLGLSATEGVVFQGVSAAALQQNLNSFVFI